MSGIKHFLLAFDHGQDKLIEQLEFGEDIDRATAAYTELEDRFKGSNLVDIVLVGSDSLESVKVTHSNYFEGGARAHLERLLNLQH